ncbi:MAG TPA: ADP-glyceromanno-heptose 6-epimerase, partial [Opitutales bacterium]|nr:ADP-glyceromanno-heptose 6-epimerase [Opitutales bacterium]
NLVPLRFDDYVEADVLSDILESQPKLLNDIRIIFHLGACSSTTETNAAYLIDNNYNYTRSLAHWALQNDTRFIYASSAATYGNGEQGMSDEADLTTLRPLNMYGYSKHLFDLYAQRQGFLDKIVGLKYFNVFGPNEAHKADMRSLVSKAFTQIQDTDRVRLFKSYRPDYKDGEQKRDFLYIKDAVAMTLHLAMNPEAGGLYNIGAGQAHSWIELVTPIFKALGKPIEIEFIDMPESIRNQYQYYTCANIDRLRATGYTRPITSLANAVEDYVSNYLLTGKHLGDA